MRTLRYIQGRLQGRIAALPAGHSPLWALSAIIGAYLSLQFAPAFGG